MTSPTNTDQTIIGTNKSNILAGGNGNDRILGNDGNDLIDGGNGNDYIDGGAGNDTIFGGAGNDTILGGDGNDVLHGDDGSDYLDGGTGTDLVFGDCGNDTLAFRLADHGAPSTAFLHANSVLDGGTDTDTFRLILTRDEWLRGDVQADVARYVAFLDAEPGKFYNFANRLFGNTDFNGSFAFNIADLVVARVEKFKVVVDGLVLDPRNEAVIARADAITTDEDHASVAFNLLANDSVPDLVKSVSVGTAAHGAVVLVQNYADPAKPVASVVYTPNATYYQYLAAGETAIDSFSYTVTDANGDTSTAIATVTITGVNDGPLIVSGSYAGAVVEDAAATLASSGAITFSDVDLTDSHTVSVGAAKVTVANDTATGIAPTGGFGTLKAVVVENTTDQNNQGTINWSFTADNATVQRLTVGQTATQVYALTLTDKNGASVTQNVTITLTGTEDAPTITSAVASGAVTEDATTAVQGNIAFADADLIDTHSVAFTPQASGYLGTFATIVDKPATGTGAGTVKWTFAVDNTLIQNLAQGETLTQKYTITVADNHGGTVQQVVTVTITGTNDAPIAVADVATPATEDGAVVTGSVATNDSDVDHGAALTYKLNAPVAGLTLAANGSYSFDPSNAAYQALAAGEVQTIVASYTVVDDKGATATTTLTIKVTGTNDAPVAVADVAAPSIEDGAIVTGSVATNDSDVDHGAVLTYKLSAPVAGLTLNSNGSYSFDASNAAYQALAAGEVQTVVGSYTVTDDKGATATTTLTITVTGTNDIPVAVADVAAPSIEDGAVVTGSVATNDSDVDHGAVLTYKLNAPVAGLTLGTNGSYSFDPSNQAYQALAAGEVQTIVASYTVTDDKGATATTTLTITVTGTNDVPVAVADTGAVAEDSVLTGTVAANDSDVDHGAVLAYTLNAPVAGLTLAANGSYSFDASNAAYQALAAGEVQTVVASYTVTDDKGAATSTTLTIKITGTNDAPVAVADTGAVVEDSVLTGSVATNDTDVDHGATRTFALNAPVAGLTLNADGGYVFNAADAAYQALAKGEIQTVIASYTVTDDKGATATTTLTIVVTGTNDAPVANADIGAVTEDKVLNGTVATNDRDIDHGAKLGYALDAPVAGLTINLDGSYSFNAGDAAYQHLAQGETAVVVAHYTVTDEYGAVAQSALTVTVTGTNDAPIAIADFGAVAEDAVLNGTVAVNDSDVDHGAVLQYTLDAPVAGLTINGDGSYAFNAANAAYQSLALGETLSVVGHYTVTDEFGATSQSTLTITVTGTNDAPVAVADTLSAVEDQLPVTGSVATNDSDVDHGATLSYTLDTPVAGLTFNANGSYSFDPSNVAYQALAKGEVQTIATTYAVIDDHGATTHTTLTITVTGTNDAPVAMVDVAAAIEDGTVVRGSVATNDFDVDHSATLTYVLPVAVAGLTLAPDGTYAFDPHNAAYQALAVGEVQTVVATYAVTDNEGVTAYSALIVTVTGTNDAPVAVADTAVAVEDGAHVAGSVATNDYDVDHNAILSYALSAPVAGLTLNAAGGYDFDPSNPAYQSLAQGELLNVVATYTVTDQSGATSTSTLTIVVAGTNDAPTAVSNITTVTEESLISGSVAVTSGDVDHGAALNYTLDRPVPGLNIAYNGSYTFDAADAAYQALAQGEVQVVTGNYTVTDQFGAAANATLTIAVTGTDDVPVAVADTNAAAEDSVIIGSVATNDSDVDHGAVLAYTLDTPVAGLTIGADGSYAFNAGNAAYQSLAQGETLTVVGHYTVTDEFGATSQSTLTVVVTGTNDVPIAVADLAAVNEDSVVAGSVASNDGDADHGAILAYALSAPIAGLTFNADGSYSFNAADAAYQALAQGEVQNVVVGYTVTDQFGATSPSTLTITITGTNDAPVVTGPLTAAATEDGAVVTIDAFAKASDVDHGTSLTVVGLPTTLPAGITYDVATHSFALDPSAGVFQALAQGEAITTTVFYSVSDGIASIPTSASWTVTGTNDAPVAKADVAAVLEDSAVSGSVATNDTDIDHGAVLTYALNAPVAGLTFGANGAYTFNAANAAYQPLAQGEVQNVVVGYTVTDQFGASSNATLTVTVTGRNDGPVAAVDTATAIEDGAIVKGNVGANDTDIDHGAVLTYAGTNTIAGLSIAADGSYSFDPSNVAYQNLGAGATRTVVGTYKVTDQFGAVANSTLSITVTGTNDAPVVGNVVLVANRLGNGGFDQTPDFTGWTVQTGSTGTTGTFSSTAVINRTGTLIAGDNAVADLNYSATTPAGYGTGYGPRITSTAFAGNAGDTVKFVYLLSSGTDQAVGTGYIRDAATGAIVQTIFNYQVPFIGSTGVQTVNLTLATSGTYTIDFQLGSYDATGGRAIGARLEIGFAGILANGIGEDVPFTFSGGKALLLANATDVDVGDVLTVNPFAATSMMGAVVTLNAAGALVVDPTLSPLIQALKQGESATDSFTYQVSDGHGGLTTATASYTLTGANDAPVAIADTASAIEGGTVVAGTVAANDSDLDHGAVLAFKLNAAVAGLTFNPNGTYSFDATNSAYDSLAAGATKQVVASYTVIDEFGATATSNLTITVTGTNDAPVAVADTFTVGEDGSLTLASTAFVANDTDVDGDTQTVSAINTTGTLGTASLLGGVVTYTAGSAFQYLKDGQTAVDHFTYTISDGHGGFSTATETVIVTGANDAPTAVGDAVQALAGTTTTFAVLGNDTDPENDTLSIASVTNGAHGTVAVNADGTLNYSAAAGYGGTDSFTYTVKDPGGLTSTATVSVYVDRPPVAVADAYTINSGGNVKLAVATNDTDPDNDALKVISVGTAAHGTLTINADNTINYASTNGYVGADSFQYTISDGHGGTATGAVSLTVKTPETAVAPTLVVGSSTAYQPTNGSAIMTTVALHAGDVVSFDWNFSSGDYLPFNDFAFATVNGAVFTLSNTLYTGNYGATGWQTFTYVAPADGVYTVGQGVMNNGDTGLDSHLGIDALRINGAIVQSFENGFGATTISGNAVVNGGLANIMPTNGTSEAYLTSSPSSESAIESFLGIAQGKLVTLGQANGAEFKPVTVPIGIALSPSAHPDATFVTITGAPVGSTFNHGVYDAATNSWKVDAGDLGGNLTITTPSNYAGTFALAVTATSVVYGSNTSATTAPQYQSVTVNPASVELLANAAGSTLIGGTLDDILHSGAGNDTLTGGTGADVFDFGKMFGKDTITDFHAGQDSIYISSSVFATGADALSHSAQVGSNVVITYDANNMVTLTGVNLADLHATDFQIA